MIERTLANQFHLAALKNELELLQKAARGALAALGYTPGGERWTLDRPLPTNKRERAALALGLLVREMFGGWEMTPEQIIAAIKKLSPADRAAVRRACFKIGREPGHSPATFKKAEVLKCFSTLKKEMGAQTP